MLIERKPGMIVISELIYQHLVTRRYIGYTLAEAKRAFNAEFKR